MVLEKFSYKIQYPQLQFTMISKGQLSEKQFCFWSHSEKSSP